MMTSLLYYKHNPEDLGHIIMNKTVDVQCCKTENKFYGWFIQSRKFFSLVLILEYSFPFYFLVVGKLLQKKKKALCLSTYLSNLYMVHFCLL